MTLVDRLHALKAQHRKSSDIERKLVMETTTKLQSEMRHWDLCVAPYLQEIERAARWSCFHARKITASLAVLHNRPDFETKAEDELRNAKKDLQEALARIEAAEHAYHNIPLMEAAE